MSQHLVLHGLAVKKHADADALTRFTGLPAAAVKSLLANLVRGGRVVETRGRYMVAPLARVVLEGQYATEYAALRGSPGFAAAHEAFERINVLLKALITDWQTVSIGGSRVANDHSDRDYDMSVIDRLGDLHAQAEGIIARLQSEVPRFDYYARGLATALERAEAGEREWVSDARIDSYHTLWFELHEDLLRLLGWQRRE